MANEERTEKNMVERHLTTLHRRLQYLIEKRDKQGATGGYTAAEIAALKWVLFYWKREGMPKPVIPAKDEKSPDSESEHNSV